MAQVKIFGLKENLNPIKERFSEVIHTCVVEAFKLPADKKFHRFFPMDREDFHYAPERTEAYTIIELSIFEGRSVESKKHLIRSLFEHIQQELRISPQDIEITIIETLKSNWGIRGLPGDELQLNLIRRSDLVAYFNFGTTQFSLREF
ncbi:tautomerase family protein [Paenibacillus odorifer]|nr:tautomerase family protein [Paenibacillus odorifer]